MIRLETIYSRFTIIISFFVLFSSLCVFSSKTRKRIAPLLCIKHLLGVEKKRTAGNTLGPLNRLTVRFAPWLRKKSRRLTDMPT